MIMSYPATGGATGVTAVDCQKQVRSWRLLRSVAELLLPTCNCIITHETDHREPKSPPKHPGRHRRSASATSYSTVSGTLYGCRRGKAIFCIQANPSSTSPLLLLELAIPTNVLAKEMKGGSIRFAFECEPDPCSGSGSGSGALLSMPAWTMYCNGRRLGFAVKRKPSRADVELMHRIQNVVIGAGIASLDDDVMYLRGKFERFHGSANSDSFHLIDSEAASNGQELSFYFFRRN